MEEIPIIISPEVPPIISPVSETSSTSSFRIRRKSLGLGPGRSPDFEDPYDTRWQEQFDAAPLRPYKTNDEYLYAMREDLADWLNDLYNIDITSENFFEKLETGSRLCQHANNVRRTAIEFKQTQASIEDPADDVMNIGHSEIRYKPDAVEGTFIARDNVSNFIHWCRHCLNINDVLLFETDDLVLRKNIKSFILCLLEVARRGGRVGMPVPMLVQFEKEIEMELRNSINLSGMIPLPSEKSDSFSMSTGTGPTSPSSVEPESPSSEMSDSSSFLSSSGRYSPDALPGPPILKDSKSKSKSLPRPNRDAPYESQLPLRRNNSLRRPRQLPCIPTKSNGNVNVKGKESLLHKRMKNHTSSNRHSLPSALEDLHADLEDDFIEEGPVAQIMLQPAILKSLHERVRELVNRCTCPAQFPMIREAEGKYRIGEAATLIFVRILRNHVMVRVGGGWDTLEHYLDKHDPCRCDVHRKKKKAHQRAVSQPGVPMRRSQSPVQNVHVQNVHVQQPQRTRRLSGGTSMRHSWGNKSWDESVWERPKSQNSRPSSPNSRPRSPNSRPRSPDSPSSTKSATTWRRTTDSMDTDAQLSSDLTKTGLKVNGSDEDSDLLSPASDLSAVERLIEEQTAKADKSPTDVEFPSGSPLTSPRSSPVPQAPKRPSRISKTEQTKEVLQRRRSLESPNSVGKLKPDGAFQIKSAPSTPKRNGASLNSSANAPLDRESPMESSSDVWRRFAMAGAGIESAFAPVTSAKPRSSQQASSRSNRERSESPLTTRNRSLTPTPPKRKSRHDRENKSDNVLMIKRDSDGRHRLGSNSSCESNDSNSVDGASSGRRTPDKKRSYLGGRDGAKAERTRPRSTEPIQLKGQRLSDPHGSSGGQRRRRTVHGDNPEHAGAISRALKDSVTSAVERQRPSSAGPGHSYQDPTKSSRRRRTTVHGDNSELDSAVSQSLQNNGGHRRKLPIPQKRVTSAIEHQRPSSAGPIESYGSTSPRRRRTTVNGNNPEHVKALKQSLQSGVTSSIERQRPSSAGPSQSTRRRRTTVHGDNPEHVDAIQQSLQSEVTSSVERQRPSSAGPAQSHYEPSRSTRRRRTTVHGDNPEDSNVIQESLQSEVTSSIERQRPSSAGPAQSHYEPSRTTRRRRTVHGDNPEHANAIQESLQSEVISSIERQRPSSAGPTESNYEPSRSNRRRRTVHGDNPEHASAISRSLQENGVRRKLPTPPEEYAKRSTGNNVWRRTPDVFDDALRSSLEANLGASSSYSRSRSGNSSPVNRSRPPSRLRPVTPVPRHMKVDSHIVTPVRRDEEHKTPSRIPMPVQHKKMLDGTEVRTRSLPDLMDLPRWLVRRIEQQNLDLEYNMDNVFDCSQSHCSSMDSVSPTPSVKAENPNDSGYEDNSATKISPLSTLSFGDDADTIAELPGQELAETASETAMEEDKLIVDL